MAASDDDGVTIGRTPYGALLFSHRYGRLEAQPAVGLAYLEVDAAHRRRGIATRLLGAYERVMRRAHAERIVFTCARANAPALALYAKLGYTIAAADDDVDEAQVVVSKRLERATAAAARDGAS